MDFSMKSYDYDKKIKKNFLGNPDISLWLRLGFTNDSYELRLKSPDPDKFIFDLFLSYEVNETHQYSGYHYKDLKLK